MARLIPFIIDYDEDIWEHLKAIDPKYHSLIQETIREQLLHQPEKATRNRKPLLSPGVPRATWELRLGPDNRFRVFYRIEPEDRIVKVLAIGVKDRSKLYIAGKEQE